MSRFSRDFRSQETPFTQLDHELSDTETDGTLARELGMVPRRFHQVGASYFKERSADPRSIHYVWPMSACPGQKPAQRQAKPPVKMPSPGG